jgi:predicted anti-sigma-YlaC factor YlaD
MERPCREIQGRLVDYADGQLSSADSSKVAEHLADCDKCRKILDALQRSLELAGVIWIDGLAETENIHVPTTRKTERIRPLHYAAVAASILLVLTASIVWRASVKPKEAQVTFADIERKITESASAARLLAATELLAEYPEAQPIVDQQYRYIVETYPQTSAATKAQSRIQ